MKYTTIEDLYKWAIENDALNLPIGIQYQDAGGFYHGDTFMEDSDDREITAVLASYEGTNYVNLF